MVWINLSMTDFVKHRQNMIDTQLRTNKITDERLLDALLKIPRELFVPEKLSARAYIDEDLNIGEGRYLIQPMIFARMIQSVAISSNDVVLDVACGTAYSSAVIGRLAGTVVALESEIALIQKATALLSSLGLDNVMVEKGSVKKGWKVQAPYDVITINGACSTIPETFFGQLAEGGRLCAVNQDNNGVGKACLWIKNNNVVSRRELFDANSPSLSEFIEEKGFVL